MRPIVLRGLLLVLLVLLVCSPLLVLRPAAAQQQEVELDYTAADPDAPPVTEATLLENERFWPYRVRVQVSWPPPGAGQGAVVAARTGGVLVRVEPSGRARIDFGSHGRFDVPVGKTDIVERANRVRLGQMAKLSPNFVHAVGPRLVDTAFAVPRAVPFEALLAPRGFLAVFAAPDAFEALNEALGPLQGRADVLTVLFPQGDHPDPEIRTQLRELGWNAPFVYDALSEGYTRAHLPEGTELPAVMLVTPDGRLLFHRHWTPELLPELTAALDTAFGARSEDAARDSEAVPAS